MTATINVDRAPVSADVLTATGSGYEGEKFITLRVGDVTLILHGFGLEAVDQAIEIAQELAEAVRQILAPNIAPLPREPREIV